MTALPIVIFDDDNKEEAVHMKHILAARADAPLYAVKQGKMTPWLYADKAPVNLIKQSNGAKYLLDDVYYTNLSLKSSEQRRARRTTMLAIGTLRATGE